MKKLLFAFIVALGMSFISCGHSEATTEAVDTVEVTTDSLVETVVVDTVAVDSVVVDSVL